MRAAAEFLAELVGDAADVSSLGAGEYEMTERLLVLAELKLVNVDEAWFAFDFDAFAREFVKRHAAFFDSGNHRRSLHLIADELSRGFVQLVHSQGRHGQRSHQLAIRIVAVGCLAKFY